MLALCLQFIPDEVEAVEDLLGLIVDLEPQSRRDVELMLFYRRDVRADDVRRLAARTTARFPRTLPVECWDYADGWPAGPNAMWACLMRQLFDMGRNYQLTADAALTFEPDCIPVSENWISELDEAWSTRPKGKDMIGHMHPNPKNPTHINGNAIFRTDFWKLHEEVTGCHASLPWDVVHGPLMLKVGADCPRIMQDYRREHFSLADWKKLRTAGVSLFHGVKSGEARSIARQQLVEKPHGRRNTRTRSR